MILVSEWLYVCVVGVLGVCVVVCVGVCVVVCGWVFFVCDNYYLKRY